MGSMDNRENLVMQMARYILELEARIVKLEEKCKEAQACSNYWYKKSVDQPEDEPCMPLD